MSPRSVATSRPYWYKCVVLMLGIAVVLSLSLSVARKGSKDGHTPVGTRVGPRYLDCPTPSPKRYPSVKPMASGGTRVGPRYLDCPTPSPKRCPIVKPMASGGAKVGPRYLDCTTDGTTIEPRYLDCAIPISRTHNCPHEGLVMGLVDLMPRDISMADFKVGFCSS